MITVRVRSNTGTWYDVTMPCTRAQLKQARAAYAELRDGGHAIDQGTPSRALARVAMDRAKIPPAPNGFDELTWGSAVMCEKRSLRWK